MFQKLKRKCRPTTILLAIGFSISIMSVLVGISAINDILTSLAEADQEIPIFNTMQNTGISLALSIYLFSIVNCLVVTNYWIITKRRDMAIRKAFGWSNYNLICAVGIRNGRNIACQPLHRVSFNRGVFTHDRGYYIHSYNTFFPMWYASALAFYIGDFRYHSCYSHFENTPSGGDFINETFKIIYQGNRKNKFFSILILLVCVIAMQTVLSAITNATSAAYQQKIFESNIGVDMEQVLHLDTNIQKKARSLQM